MPDKLRIKVVNAVGLPIEAARIKLVVRRGAEWRVEVPDFAPPSVQDLRPGFIQLEVDAAAPNYVEERAVLTWLGGRWETTNPAWALDERQSPPLLRIALGRIRFAPIVMLPDDLRVKPPFNPGAVLVNDRGYRRHSLNPTAQFRALKQPAIGDPDASGWERFQWSEQNVDLASRGNWMVLEYGDPSGRPDALRHLIGVWAPHKYPGRRPPVVVQITPNTRPVYYPVDKLPFTGLYPYGCVAPGAALDKGSDTVALKDCGQAYVELLSNRCFGEYKIVHQLYAARPDLFEGPHGPVVITPAPALTSNAGIIRQPLQHREAMGRLIAEVLRFLWSRMLTLDALGSVRLRLRPPTVTITGGARPPVAPTGFPASTLTTLVCHSAGVGPVLELAGHASGTEFPKGFPAALFGGRNEYCGRDWNNLWVIDGVASPGGIGVPAPGGPAANTWAAWLKGEGRTMTLVYTPSGLGGTVAPKLISLTSPPRTGAAGWIEEGTTGKFRWLRMSYEYLQKADPADPAGVIPAFAPLKSGASPAHNKVYEFGVGYAARKPSP